LFGDIGKFSKHAEPSKLQLLILDCFIVIFLCFRRVVLSA